MERFMQTAMDSDDVVVITKAESGVPIVYVNKAFTKQTEYSLEEVLGKNPKFLQGENTCKESTKNIKEALEKIVPIRQEVINYTKSHNEYTVELNIFPYYEAGICTHFISIHKNITINHHIEQQLKEYKKFFDETPVALLRTDIKTSEILMANKFCAELLGYNSVYELIMKQKTINLYENKEQRRRLINKIKKMGFIQNHEIELILHNGCKIWVLVNLHINCGGSCIEGSMIDITYHKEMEQELHILQAQHVEKLSKIGNHLDSVLTSYSK